MRTLALSGWGQPHDALAAILPDATHFDYAHYNSADEAITAIAEAAKLHDVVVGWSLGGQLAVRAIASKKMWPKKLVLIAAPFQFVRGGPLAMGMPQDIHATFMENYTNNPDHTLRKAWDLIAYGDVHEAHVKAHLNKQNRKKELEKNWLRWLEELSQYHCGSLDLNIFPPTLLIHGDKDAVVWHEQSQHFAKLLPQPKLKILPGCGHAPHWHDSQKLQELIKSHV